MARYRLERGTQVITPTGRRAEVEEVDGDRDHRCVKLRYLDEAGGEVEFRGDKLLTPARGRRIRRD